MKFFFLLPETFPLSGPSRWGTAMALYMIGFIAYGATLVFYAASFPRLARNTSHARKLRDMYQAGEISAEKYEAEESLEKNRISNISTVCFWFGFSSLPPDLFLEGPQQYRIHCHTLPELGPVTAFRRASQSQQLRFSIVRARIAAMTSLLTTSMGRVNSYWVVVGVWWCEAITTWYGVEWLKLLSSYLPTATPRSTIAKRFLVSDYRLETGRLPQPMIPAALAQNTSRFGRL